MLFIISMCILLSLISAGSAKADIG